MSNDPYGFYVAQNAQPTDDPYGFNQSQAEKEQYPLGKLAHDLDIEAKRGAARGTEFMLDVANAPVNFANRLINASGAFFNDQDGMGDRFSDAWEAYRDTPSITGASTAYITGMDQPKEELAIPEGENAAADFARGATRLGAEYAVTAPMTGLKKTGEALKLLPFVSGGAGTGQIVGGDTGADIGSLVGGFSPLLKSFVTLGGTGKGAAQTAWRSISKSDTPTNAEVRDAIGELYYHAYPNQEIPLTPEYLDGIVDTVKKNLEAGKQGTLGQLANDRGIIEFERNLTKGVDYQGKPISRDTQTQFQQTQQALAEQGNQVIGDVAPTGNVAQAGVPLQQQESTLRQSMQAQADKVQQQGRAQAQFIDESADMQKQAINQQTAEQTQGIMPQAQIRAESAQAQAQQQADQLVPQAEEALTQTKQRIAQQQNASTQAMLQKAAPEGIEITEGGQAGMRQLRDSVNAGYARAWENAPELTQQTRDALVSRLKDALDEGGFSADGRAVIEQARKAIKNMPAPNDGGNFQALDRTIRDLMSDPSADNAAIAELRRLRAMLRSDLPDGGAALQQMDSRYPEFLQMERSFRQSNLTGTPKASTVAGAERAIVKGQGQVSGGETTYGEDIRNMYADEQLAKEDVQLANREVTAANRQAETIRKQGVRTADDIVKAAEGEVKTVTDEATDAAKMVDAEAAAAEKVVTQQAEDTAKVINRGAENVYGKPSSEFAQAGRLESDKIQAAKNIMRGNSKDRVGDLNELLFDIGDNPQAREDLRRAFAEEMRNTINKDGQLSKKGFDQFKQDRQIYEESGLFTTKELDRVEAGLAEAQKLYLYDSPKLAKLPPVERRLTEATAALFGAKVGALALGSPLIGASLGRRTATRLLDKYGRDRINALAYEMTVNPDKFVKYAEQFQGSTPTQKQIEKTLLDMFAEFGIAARPAAETYAEDEN